MTAYFPPHAPYSRSYLKHSLDIQYSYYVFNAAEAKKLHKSWRTYIVCCNDGDGYGDYYDIEYNLWVDADYAEISKRFKDGDHIYFGDANYTWILENANEFRTAFQPRCVHCHKARAEKADHDHLHCEMRAIEALGWKTYKEW